MLLWMLLMLEGKNHFKTKCYAVSLRNCFIFQHKRQVIRFSFHHRMRDRNIVLLAIQLRLYLKKVSTQSLAECNFIWRSTSLAPPQKASCEQQHQLTLKTHLFRNLDIQKKARSEDCINTISRKRAACQVFISKAYETLASCQSHKAAAA